jgi:hypothetical protein
MGQALEAQRVVTPNSLGRASYIRQVNGPGRLVGDRAIVHVKQASTPSS